MKEFRHHSLVNFNNLVILITPKIYPNFDKVNKLQFEITTSLQF